MENYQKIKLNERNCNLCGKNEFIVLEIDEPYRVIKCSRCNLICVHPFPDLKRLEDNYSEGYYAAWINEQINVRNRIWKNRLRKVKKFKNKGKLLDVGCGSGLFLNKAKTNGWEVSGTEISEYAVKRAKDKFDIDVFRGMLYESEFKDNFFDVITIWHVLEHTNDPMHNLVEARRILKNDGLLIIAVPNINDYIYRLAYMIVKFKKPLLFDKANREIHLYHFSIRTLTELLEKAGFKVVKSDVDTQRSFWGEKIIDDLSWLLHKIIRVNFGSAIEIFAKKN